MLQKLLRGAEESKLADTFSKSGDLPKFYYLLGLLRRHHFLSYTLAWKGKKLVTFFPLTDFSLRTETISATRQFHLSRFSLLRASEAGTILENPLFSGHCLVHDQRVVTMLHELSAPKSLKQLPKGAWVCPLLTALLQAKFICTASEEQNVALAQWEFHDLLFHAKTRLGRHNNPYGGVYPFMKRIPPLPVCKSLPYAKSVALYKPDIDTLKQSDVSFTHVLEERRSQRAHGKAPITAKQLGEFLFRAARIKNLMPESKNGQLSRRPYPGGGAIYELELYPVVHHCKGLAKGIYHYDPKEHKLCSLEAESEKVEALLRDAQGSTAAETTPQVLIVIAARFQRMAWKYRSMAYATTLKNAGVLIQTMYLVATAMRLAPCAIGGGNADLFTEVAKTNYLEETSVGEFMLGSSV